MNKLQLNVTELVLITVVAITTVITMPPRPLIAIPFLIIISMRTIFDILITANTKNENK